jgi:hypothetical protein
MSHCSLCQTTLIRKKNKQMQEILNSIHQYVLNLTVGKNKVTKLSKNTILKGQNQWNKLISTIQNINKIDFVIDFLNFSSQNLPQKVIKNGVIDVRKFCFVLSSNELINKTIFIPVHVSHKAKKEFNELKEICAKNFKNVIFFEVPFGHNDDWYYLYTSIYHDCYLITHDNLKDHISTHAITNEAKAAFEQWKNDHIVKLRKDSTLLFPLPYSRSIQICETNIHIPIGGKWYCAKNLSKEHCLN